MIKFLLSLVCTTSFVFAHTAIMSCFDNADGTITCEGGFSDGSSASGVKFHILQNGDKILEARMNEDSEITFNKPASSYSVMFDAGEGHKIYIQGSDITE